MSRQLAAQPATQLLKQSRTATRCASSLRRLLGAQGEKGGLRAPFLPGGFSARSFERKPAKLAAELAGPCGHPSHPPPLTPGQLLQPVPKNLESKDRCTALARFTRVRLRSSCDCLEKNGPSADSKRNRTGESFHSSARSVCWRIRNRASRSFSNIHDFAVKPRRMTRLGYGEKKRR
jgi:hypothetical protein